MKNRKCLVSVLFGFACAALAILAVPAAHAQSVVQSYGTKQNLQIGMIVRLVPGQTNMVEPATAATQADMFGIVINPSDAAVTLSGGGSGQSVYVATSGTYEVLVSNQEGAIKIGDYVTISSLDGIGTKTGTTQSYILGKAVGNFNGTNDVLNTAMLTTSTGKKITVSIGEIPVAVGIGHNPQQVTEVSDVPGFLQHVTHAVVNKQVNASRIYLSLAILGATVVIVAIMLYAGVRNGMVAIGRNPLSRRSIVSSLWQVIFLSLLIFVIALGAVYVLLRF